jgi:drug/metabolite transporter (DMT)-like permease
VWVLYALLAAFCLATADALSKRLLGEAADERIISWIRFLFACPFLVLVWLFIEIPPLDAGFWTTVAVLVPIELLAITLYIRAIKLSPLSLTIPFLSLTPVFLIVLGWVALGERIDAAGAAGIALIVIGAYGLNGGSLREGWLAPLRAIAREPGSRLMIAVAFLYSVTSTLGKAAILASGPAAFAVVYTFTLAASFAPVVFATARPQLIQLRTHAGAFLAVGLFWALMILLHTLALAQAEAAYMIAVKRTSLLFSVLYGRLLFGEGQFRERFAGTIVMCIGVAIIATR